MSKMAENEIRKGKGRLGRMLRNRDGYPQDYRDTLMHIVRWQEHLVQEGVVKRHLLPKYDHTFADQLSDSEVIDLFSACLYELLGRRFQDPYGEDDSGDGSEGVGEDDSTGNDSSA